ncbi:bis(5'-nucleosyl)-tetraphosphatase PrpE [Bacillaceae bacterium Marseille-Q3522]|nr:bis(5'-nucleosyl)-tetraphosphatase PrpE [Bacillaceae bacterium Marseille-Q3522]
MRLDIIGDIHGCFQEFKSLTLLLGYQWENDCPVHPEDRQLAFLGDLTDRGPESVRTIETVWRLVCERKQAFYVPGNHCNKLYRYLCGNQVQISHGLETTVAEIAALSERKQMNISKMFRQLYQLAPLYKQFDNGKLVLAHAGISEALIGKNNRQVKTFVLYGDITGKKNPDGSPERRDWAKNYYGDALIIYGHTPVKAVRKIRNTYNIDTGAVFGGSLTAFRYPERTTVSVPSSMPYAAEKFRSFTE